MSLVLINGILTFMLSPGDWITNPGLSTGWFNPTMLPSLLLRTVSSIAVAAIFAIIVASLDKKLEHDDRSRIIRYSGAWLLSLVLMIPLSFWYFGMAPAPARNLALGGAVAMTMFLTFGLVVSTILGLYAWFGVYKRSHEVNLPTALTMLAISAIATGSLEFVREGIRKPYVVYGHMYSNSILVREVPELDKVGILSRARWAVPQDTDRRGASEQQRGKWVFDAQCSQCHTLDGFNGIKPLVAGWNRDLIDVSVSRLHEMKYFMPPFVGTDQERKDLGAWLDSLDGTDTGRPLRATPPANPPARVPPARRAP